MCSRLHWRWVSGVHQGGSGGEPTRRGGCSQAHSSGLAGAVRSAPWAASDRTVLRRATAPPGPAASQPMARVCANTASLGTVVPSASAPTASTASAARCPAPATQSTASGGPRDTGHGLRRPVGEAFGAEASGITKSARHISKGGTDVTGGKRRALGTEKWGAFKTAPSYPCAPSLGNAGCPPQRGPKVSPGPRLRAHRPPPPAAATR